MRKEKTEESTVNKYAVFFRGINIGNSLIIKMQDLKKAFESLGYEDVKTVQNSGNVIFEAVDKSIETISLEIKAKMNKIFSRDISIALHPFVELVELKTKKPFIGEKEGPDKKFYVTFIPGSENKKVIFRDENFKVLLIYKGMICSVLRFSEGVGTIYLMDAIQKQYGKAVTTRTWGTVLKVLGKA